MGSVTRVCTDGIDVYTDDESKWLPVDWTALAAYVWADNRRPLPHSPKIDALALALVERGPKWPR